MRGEDFLIRMLDQDAGARVLGEVALGCNYAVTRHTRNTLFDEKIGGTFHVALGAAYPESGGINRSGLHWDLVGDLRSGGRVEADGRLISLNGRFLDRSWPQPDGAESTDGHPKRTPSSLPTSVNARAARSSCSACGRPTPGCGCAPVPAAPPDS